MATSSGRLATYRQKRDFSRSPEPEGARALARSGRRFVVQKHAARRLHHDFRLEIDGVLVSWAIPKGPPVEPGTKALAVRTEDHPLEYGAFEGVIPAGEYGGGSVMLWDRGAWEPEGDARRGLARGKLDFRLAGERLRGRWTLVRMRAARARGSGGGDWLLIKRTDDDAAGDGAARRAARATLRRLAPGGEERSVATGRTMDEIAAGVAPRRNARAPRASRAPRAASRKPRAASPGVPPRKTRRTATKTKGGTRKTKGTTRKAARKAARTSAATAARTRLRTRATARTQARKKASEKVHTRASPKARALDPGALPGARRRAQPAALSPELARLEREPPDGDGWLHEIKLDGYRLLAFTSAGAVRLVTRGAQDWTARFPVIARAIGALGLQPAILDGEVVVLDERGVSDFQALQNSLEARAGERQLFFAFDLPYAGGFDLRATPLEARKRLLAAALGRPSRASVLRFSEHVVGAGRAALAHACELGLEGILSKRRDSPYTARRSGSWIKTKCLQRQELVIGGWTEPTGARSGLGALLLGTYDARGRLVYAGRVGTGFSERSLASLAERLAPLATDAPPFVDPPRGAQARGAHWVEPRLVAEVAFTQWTADGRLRHPSFQGLREDKPPAAVRRERPGAVRRERPRAAPRERRAQRAGKA